MSVTHKETPAWYTAGAAGGAVSGSKAETANLTTADAVASVEDLYAHFTVVETGAALEVAVSTSDGLSYAIINGHLVPASGTVYKSVSLQFEGWYTNAACTSAASPEQIANIAGGKSITFVAAASSMVRITNTNPSSDFATAFSGSLGKDDLAVVGRWDVAAGKKFIMILVME